MSSLQLEKFENMLKEEKRRILEELLSENEDYSALNDNSIGDLVDQAYKFYEKELLIGLSDTEKEILELVDRALNKIKDGTYGICEKCKKNIPVQRLEAIPYAKYCIECKSKTSNNIIAKKRKKIAK